jgi:D-erythronate 2-dehydrogenase
MVRVVVTGGAGFVGSRLARELLASGTLSVAGAPPGELSRVTIVDRVPPPGDLAADDRVTAIQTEITEVTRETLDGADAVFHLAAAVSGECEADFDLGLRANLRGTEAVLAACRALGTAPVVVFTSSYAVFGGSAIHPLPPVIDDQTPPNPQTSYGTQKAMLELLLADYTRKGYLRGRAMRLATISVRAGRPNTAASSFLSGIIREPLAGIRGVCPVPHGTEAALASPAKAVAALIRAATATGEEWGDNTAVTMPSLTTTVDEMAAALERVAGPEVSALIDWAEDPVVAKIVLGWPTRVKADRAARLGLAPDPDVEEIIRRYIADSRTQLSRTEPWCQRKVHASASRAHATGIWPRSCVTSSVSGRRGRPGAAPAPPHVLPGVSRHGVHRARSGQRQDRRVPARLRRADRRRLHPLHRGAGRLPDARPGQGAVRDLREGGAGSRRGGAQATDERRTVAVLYMVIERYLSGPGPVYERASAQGRMLPEGLEYVASWVEGDSMDRCFQLMETSDPALFGVWTERWADLVSFEIVPVVTSAEAASRHVPTSAPD